MKTIYSLAMGLLMAWGVNAQTFKKAKGRATDVSISESGEVFVVGTSKQIFKYHFNIEDFKLYSVANRRAKTITAAKANNVWLLTTDGRIHITYTKNKIQAMGSLALRDIYVGKNNVLWGIDTKGAIKKKDGSWKPFTMAGTDNKKVAVNNTTGVFAIKNNNSIWSYVKGRGPRRFPGEATDIAYDHVQKKLYVLSKSTKRIMVWNPSRNRWDAVKNTRRDFKSIAAHNGQLWGTTTQNAIYTTAAIKNTEIPVAKDFSGRYRVTVSHIYENTNRVPPRPDAELFGTIGVRLYGKGRSGKVEIRALENKPPRIWSASRSRAQVITQNHQLKKPESFPRSMYNYWGRYEIGKSREYEIQGELANEKLAVNIQMNVHAKGLLLDEEYPWQTKTIAFKDLVLGKVYIIESKILKHRYKALAVTFKVEKY